MNSTNQIAKLAGSRADPISLLGREYAPSVIVTIAQIFELVENVFSLVEGEE